MTTPLNPNLNLTPVPLPTPILSTILPEELVIYATGTPNTPVVQTPVYEAPIMIIASAPAPQPEIIVCFGPPAEVINFSTATTGLNINMPANTYQAMGSSTVNVLTNYYTDNVTGTKYADLITGSGWMETINAGAGNDTIIGSGGADALNGGAGVDTLDFSASTSQAYTPIVDMMPGQYAPNYGVNISLQKGTGKWGDAEGDTYTNFENVIGTTRDDFITGNSSANNLKGGAGNDYLWGNDGNDVLEGGIGDDFLDGGKGADKLIGGDGLDTVNYSNSTSGVTVNLKTGLGSGGEATGDRYTSIENAKGSDFNDIFTGSNQNNKLEGGAGNDLFHGGQGADTMNGGEGIDTVSYANSNQSVTVSLEGFSYSGGAAPNAEIIQQLMQNYINGYGGDANGDQLNGIEVLIGSAHNDILEGSYDNNTISGGKGDDTISGGGGNDVLTGGAGNDTFIYSFGAGNDVIKDFKAGASSGDKIVFTQEAFQGEAMTYQNFMSHATQVGSNLVFNFVGETLTLNNVLKSQLNADDFELILTTTMEDYPVPSMVSDDPGIVPIYNPMPL